MSRYDQPGESDRDRGFAKCDDCGTAIEDDATTWCLTCADQRDAWTTAQEIRIMAKAFLRADLSKVKEVA